MTTMVMLTIVHGWNFLGRPNGQNAILNETTEEVREYGKAER